LLERNVRINVIKRAEITKFFFDFGLVGGFVVVVSSTFLFGLLPEACTLRNKRVSRWMTKKKYYTSFASNSR
jgi:hypothetical protein